MEQTKFKYGTLFNKDCIKAIKELPDKSIDFILTDPPYFEIKMAKKRTKKGIDSIADFSIKLDEIKTSLKPKDWFCEALRVLKKVNMIIWLDDRHQLFDYLLEIKNNNLKYYVLNWIKTNPVPINNLYYKDHEMALYIFEKEAINYLNDYENKKTTYNFPIGNDVSWHPTPKPLSIIEKQILKHTKENDIVLDLFSGSGTTATICELNKRKWLAYELNKNFYKKSIERIKNQGGQEKFKFEME